MSTVTEILTTEFEALKSELIAAYDAKGMRSTGVWADNLEVNVTEGNGQIKGLPYSQQLETGRAPGKQPPSEAIEKWIIAKGLAANLERNISISSLAYLIARKIAREGWKRERFGGVDLISEVVTPERIQQIMDKVSDIYIGDFSNEIINYFKQAA